MKSYIMIQRMFRAIFKILLQVEVTGTEHIPPRGPYILAVNHLTLLEPPLLLAYLPTGQMKALVARKWARNPVLGWIVKGTGSIFINRDQVDRQALKEALQHLKQDGILGLAPEGTRSRSGGLMAAKTGVAYLATRARVPILPVGISGQPGYAAKLKRFQRPHIRIKVGPPLQLPPLSRGDKNAQLNHATDRVMVAIARLLDPELRGIYANQVHTLDPYQNSPQIS